MNFYKIGNPLHRDFNGYETLFFEMGEKTDVLLAAFNHKTDRGAGAGKVRYWP
jgi:hypothetical protein